MTNLTTVGATWLNARRALQAHSETPGLDAQLLLCEVTQRERAWLLAHPEQPLDEQQSRAYAGLLRRCLNGEALPYVLGWWEFYGRRFTIDPSVLIPRPETEHLIEHALDHLFRQKDAGLVLDVGTGSGCIAATLALEVSHVRVVASDVDAAALRVARTNASRHRVANRIYFLRADLAGSLCGRFDLICANLPYIPRDRLCDLQVAKREPQHALDGGSGGTELIYSLLKDIPRLLSPGGRAIFEIDPSHAHQVRQRAQSLMPGAEVKIQPDLAGRDRMMVIDSMGSS